VIKRRVGDGRVSFSNDTEIDVILQAVSVSIATWGPEEHPSGLLLPHIVIGNNLLDSGLCQCLSRTDTLIQ
jgi:hypothetical protein